MNQYEIYNREGKRLFTVSAETGSEAMIEAKKMDKESYRAELVIYGHGDRRRW